jgi:hypothetical protein
MLIVIFVLARLVHQVDVWLPLIRPAMTLTRVQWILVWTMFVLMLLWSALSLLIITMIASLMFVDLDSVRLNLILLVTPTLILFVSILGASGLNAQVPAQ